MDLERNYIYLYQPGGNFHNPVLRFRAPAYLAEISAEKELGLTRFGFLNDKNLGFSDPDYNTLDWIKCSFRLFKEGKAFFCSGTRYCYSSEHWYWSAPSKFRIVEAGRYFNKVDMMDMLFEDQTLLGRFEMVALPDSFVLKFDGYCQEKTVGGVEFSLNFPEKWSVRQEGNGICARRGQNFLWISAVNAEISAEGRTVTFLNPQMELSDTFCGITARFMLNRKKDPECHVRVVSHNQEKIALTRMPDYGVYEIKTDGNNGLDFNIPENRNRCDRLVISVENPSDEEQSCVLCFAKEGEGVSLTGMSPLWRDVRTGEPNGLPVQITKDWHIHPDDRECSEWFAIPLSAPRRYYEGKWSRFYSCITLQPHSVFEGEFVCAYENWGTAPAVSHAQLSLVGWGGYDIWEQVAVGSHGENICFQADTSSQAVAFINDIRPLYTKGRHGGFRSYDWSENFGGGELLVYCDRDGRRIEFTDIFQNFREQCPVLTDTAYKLKTEDGKIEALLSVNNVRTDDVLKVFFHLDYSFREDTEYSRLALFQYDTERYQANLFRKLAWGDGDKLLGIIPLKEDPSLQGQNGYNSRYERCRSAGAEPWFYFYDSPEPRKGDLVGLKASERFLAEAKNATVLIALRRYDAVINGQKSQAFFSIRQCRSADVIHQAVELSPHLPEGRIKAGSRVSMCVELACIPSGLEQYYGSCEYLLKGGDKLDDPACALFQITEDRLQISMISGKLEQNYPPVFRCEKDVCAFQMTGGLGYVPMRFECLSDYRGFSLFRNGEKVDQSVLGNDFWQTFRDEDGTYALSFSVPNGETAVFELKRTK